MNPKFLELCAPDRTRQDLNNELFDTFTCRLSPEFPQEHVGAVNAMSIEDTESRYMLSAGGDSSIKIWDMDNFPLDKSTGDRVVDKIAEVPRKSGHEFGVSGVEWWPHDNGMFVTSSFDSTVKVWDTNELVDAYTFNLAYKVYSVSLSPCNNTLIATAADHPLLRLLDMRTTSSSHTLRGHSSGKILSVKWSPTHEHILASGGSDGTVRLWDIRRSNSCLSSFDMQQVSDNAQSNTPQSMRRAHRSSVNGLCWFSSGDYLVSSGNDEKIRVWSLLGNTSGKNTLINFGPLIRNRHIQTLNPCLTGDNSHLLYPSDNGEIFVFTTENGKVLKRLVRESTHTTSAGGGGATAARSACIVGRDDMMEYYSGSLDGVITCWCPEMVSDLYGDVEDEMETVGDNLQK